MKSLLSHVATACVAWAVGSAATYLTLTGHAPFVGATEAEAAQVQSQAAQQTVLFETTMTDVLGRVMSLRALERAPGTESAAHSHPGSHTIGYVLEGTYEVQVDDGPVRRLGPGETFYERPGGLHAVSRNGSATEVVRYLVFQVSDPTLPATVPR
jgi:quercetin dioxygenase-like cupin family protein